MTPNISLWLKKTNDLKWRFLQWVVTAEVKNVFKHDIVTLLLLFFSSQAVCLKAKYANKIVCYISSRPWMFDLLSRAGCRGIHCGHAIIKYFSRVKGQADGTVQTNTFHALCFMYLSHFRLFSKFCFFPHCLTHFHTLFVSC